jgi:colanic acid/amylovoran biosynthesis glycosyltransferase
VVLPAQGVFVKVAYVVNQYPKASHSFIRREIAALEAQGIDVARHAIRVAKEPLPDPLDRAELERTRPLLGDGVRGLLRASAGTLLARPSRALSGLAAAARMGRGSDRGLGRHAAYLAEAALLCQRVRREGFEHVHAHFGTNAAAVAMLCHELGGPPWSFTVHGPEEFDRARSIALADKIARAAFVVAVSSYGRGQLMRHTGAGAWHKLHVVPCGLDPALIDAVPTPPPSAPRLVCVGRLCEQKAQPLLIEAAARIAATGTDLELVLVGDGELRPDVEAAIARHGLTGRVRITGWASGDRVRAEIEGARALVLPSFAEGLPVAIMEAFALARPVVSTYVAGIPELVEPSRSGWLVPAGSVEQLALAMREALAARPEKLFEMGMAGRRRVLEVHDARVSAKKLASLFEGAASC